VEHSFSIYFYINLDFSIEFNRLHLEMANKPVPVGIVRIRPRFDGESPHLLGMGMGMGNPRLFQLGMGMGMGMYIYPP